MTVKTSHEPGTPCWIDLGTPDQDAAGEFYGSLFGWELEEDENAEETAGYRTAQLDGKAVGGVMKLMGEGQPPAWMTYLATEDADATTARAREAGAQVLAEPMSVLDYGRMAVLADPTGAVFGVWQAGSHSGAERVRETGSVVWSELNTRDPDAAKAFYADVFGWTYQEEEFEGTGTYTTIKLGETTVGGLLDITERVPEEVPNHWLVYFAVDDADATLATLGERGGTVAFGPVDIPSVGRIAVVQDPFGAAFALLQPDPEMQTDA
jgi:predicted enzyme related to lactoylglutathione lyase